MCTILAELKLNSSGSSVRWGWGGLRNMKSMRLPLAAISFMTYFYRAGGGMTPSAPSGSATEKKIKFLVYGIN